MTVPVFILAGQSNVSFLSNELQSAFDDEYGLGNYELVRVFDAGAPLTRERSDKPDWRNPDELRQELTVETANALLEDDDRVFGGMIWIQGEADTFSENGARRYGDELNVLFDEFRNDVASIVGDPDADVDQAPITILELSENAPDAPDRIGWDIVIDGQRDVANTDAFVQTLDPDTVGTNGNSSGANMFRDGLHYTDEFGTLLAEELVQTLEPERFSSPIDDMSPPEDTPVAEPNDVFLPVAEGVLPEQMDAPKDLGAEDDGGFGFEAILFILPLVSLAAALAG